MSKKEANLKIVSEAHTDQKEKQKALDAAISQIGGTRNAHDQ